MSIRYEVRSAALTGLPEEIARLGGDLTALLERVGLDPTALADGDRMIRIEQLIRLLAEAASCLDCADLGLRVASHQNLEMLGLLGRLLVRETDLQSAFTAAQRYLALHNKAEHWRLVPLNGQVQILRIEHFFALEGAQYYREMAIAAYARMVQSMGGGDLRPLRVTFSHSPVAARASYRQYLGCEVYFDQEHDGLIYDARVLQRPVLSMAKAQTQRLDGYLKSLLESLQQNLELQVRSLIAQTLGVRQHSLEHIAKLLDLHPRTLQRRLLEEGLCFRQLVHQVKMDHAGWYVQASNMPLTLLADVLGYADQAAFSRAFRNHFGQSPSAWRQAHR
ncbi:AraC family transcriptional regulator [Pseudomonas sp. NCCP-436]|uniref:AraC family transcriptional regulator n=1 Tax=Pseudomonas sp. NCCP-436 TaxID=2842481 RepID=UPI001C7E3694|nr:AraC family transcriptional regulator [Pseudomonas sp. NCCP-436]GIZ11753.1 AraC family transcriptional regulator [Pseudomonas sp. NCCP-436]